MYSLSSSTSQWSVNQKGSDVPGGPGTPTASMAVELLGGPSLKISYLGLEEVLSLSPLSEEPRDPHRISGTQPTCQGY